MNAVMERSSVKRMNVNYRKPQVQINRGEIWLADLGEGRGSEQQGIRPVLVCQNRMGNLHAPTTQISPISSQTKRPLPTHVRLEASKTGLHRDSTVFVEQMRTICKSRLLNKITELDAKTMEEVDTAIAISFGLAI